MAQVIPSLELGEGRPKFVVRFAFNNPKFFPPEIPVQVEDKEKMLDRAAKREGMARDGGGPPVDRDIEMVDVEDMVDELMAAGFVLVAAGSWQNYNLDYNPRQRGSKEWYCATTFTFYLRGDVKDAERAALYEQVLRRMLGEALWTVNCVYDNPLHSGGKVDQVRREGQIHLNVPTRLVDALGRRMHREPPRAAAMVVVNREGTRFFLRVVRWEE